MESDVTPLLAAHYDEQAESSLMFMFTFANQQHVAGVRRTVWQMGVGLESSSVTRFSGANSYHGSVHTSTAGGAAVDMVRGWGAKRQTYLQQQLENRSGKMMSQGIIGRDHLLRLFTEWRHLLETCGTLWLKPFVFSQYLIAGFQFQCLPQYANGFCILPF